MGVSLLVEAGSGYPLILHKALATWPVSVSILYVNCGYKKTPGWN